MDMYKYPAFSVMGIEIEYMLVHKDTLQVAPKSDELIQNIAGKIQNEVILDENIALSNELVLHVIELKTLNPEYPDVSLNNQFQKALKKLKTYLDAIDLILLPTGAHPFMDPKIETRRWHHDYADIYSQYDRIFDCRGHGWSNLQSMHVNLPFSNDSEFFTLHSAVRLLLPLLPALTASSPILDGQITGMCDARLYHYGNNQKKIPEVGGDLIPEFVTSVENYENEILKPMYSAIEPWDKEGILQQEWLNSRAAIPKFSRHSLEIRIVDTQECSKTHTAIALCIHHLLKKWCEQPDYFLNHPCPVNKLKQVYESSIHQGLKTFVQNEELFKQWQLPTQPKTMTQIWDQLLSRFCHDLDYQSQCVLENILLKGNLSDRILQACGRPFDKKRLLPVYRQLADCLMEDRPFGLI